MAAVSDSPTARVYDGIKERCGIAAERPVLPIGRIILEGLLGLALLSPVCYAVAWARQRVNSKVQADQMAASAQLRIANALEKLAARK